MNALSSGNAVAEVPRVSTRASDRPFLPGLPEPEWQFGDNPGQPVICRLSELRHHASYVRLRLTVPTSKLSALAEQGELAVSRAARDHARAHRHRQLRSVGIGSSEGATGASLMF
jgi:hypothetical protein